MGIDYQFHKIKRDVEMDSRDDCTTLWIYLVTVNCIRKNGSHGKFYVYFTRKKVGKKFNQPFILGPAHVVSCSLHGPEGTCKPIRGFAIFCCVMNWLVCGRSLILRIMLMKIYWRSRTFSEEYTLDLCNSRIYCQEAASLWLKLLLHTSLKEKLSWGHRGRRSGRRLRAVTTTTTKTSCWLTAKGGLSFTRG